jgi:hypothetical protein
MKLFHSFDTMSWGRVAIFIVATSIFWVTMQSLFSDPYKTWISTFLLASTNTVAFLMRSGKSRVEKIEDKMEELETKKEETRVKVAELMSNETKEQKENK